MYKKIFIDNKETFYRIHDDGRVMSEKTGRYYKGTIRNGYRWFDLRWEGKKYARSQHRLVAEAFLENPEHLECVHHINNDSLDNRLENLQYVTSSENTTRAYKLGLQDTKKLSLANKKRIATPEEIVYIKHQFNLEGRTLGGRKNKDFYQRMANKFGYSSPHSIYKIILGKTNKHFGEDIVQTTNR